MTDLPMKLKEYQDRCVHHGFILGAAWEFPRLLRAFRPSFSLAFRLNRLKYTTQVSCEYISPTVGEKHLFTGSSRLQSHYSPGIAIGLGLQFSTGRFQLIPECVYHYNVSRVSYLGFDEWIYTHVWLEGNTRYTYHYLQNDRNRRFDDERFRIKSFEFRMICRIRI
jgi:hypothetical protein